MELWDIYTDEREKTGRTMPRGHFIEPGDLHLVVHICLFNSAGQMLIQQRQPFKAGWPNLWDITVGGSAVAGETSRQAAERELFEELGLKMDFSAVRPTLTISFERGFDDVYLLDCEADPSALTLQPSEVQSARWADLDEILRMIGEGSFIPYYPDLIRLLFAFRHGTGGFGAHSMSEQQFTALHAKN